MEGDCLCVLRIRRNYNDINAELIYACKTVYGVFITLHPFSWWSLARFEDGIFIASFRPRFRNEMIWGVKSKTSPAFPWRVDDWVSVWFLLLTGVDEARKLTIWMKANIGPREAICVKSVRNARKSSNGLLVCKRRRRRKRPRSAALRSLRYRVHSPTSPGWKMEYPWHLYVQASGKKSLGG